MKYDNYLLNESLTYEGEFNLEQSVNSLQELMAMDRDDVLDIFSKHAGFDAVIPGKIPGYKIIEIDNTLIEMRPCKYLNYDKREECFGIILKLKAVKMKESDTYDFSKLVDVWVVDDREDVASAFTKENCWLPVPFDPLAKYNSSLSDEKLLTIVEDNIGTGKYHDLWAIVVLRPELRDEVSKILRANRDEQINNVFEFSDDVTFVNGMVVMKCVSYVEGYKKQSYSIDPYLNRTMGGYPLSFSVSKYFGYPNDVELDKVTKAISILTERVLGFELGIDSIADRMYALAPTLELLLKEQGLNDVKVVIAGSIFLVELSR